MGYWDWSNEPTPSQVKAGAKVLALNSGLGGDSDGKCLTDGSPFSKGKYDPERGNCLIRDVDYKDDPWCLFPNPQQLMDIVDSTDSFASFASTLENRPHAAAHVCVGGNGGHMGDFKYSPDDPLFWMHHNMIDMQWALWQDCNNYDGQASISSKHYSG